MFRSFIYLDEDKMYTYMRQIKVKSLFSPSEMKQKKSASLSVMAGPLAVTGEAETNTSGNYEQDVSIDYDHFELALSQMEGEDYFDSVLNAYDFSNMPPMRLARVCSSFHVPEEFDMINMTERFKPMLMEQIPTNSTSEQLALEDFIGKASADIPILFELDNITVACKLNAKYLWEEYASLEDYAEQDVYMLIKIVGVVRKKRIVIFDPYKDFIHAPRAFRRQTTVGNANGMNKIEIDGPVLKAEVIAIYK